MTLTPRAKLVLLASFFLLPIVASMLVYKYGHVEPSANYGELLPPKPMPGTVLVRPDGGVFAFPQVSGKWVLLANDAGSCPASCQSKLVTMRQVRLAMGRNAERVERVFLVDDARLAPELVAAWPGLRVASRPAGMAMPEGPGNDRAHIYLIDPHGDVMMRWPAAPDGRRMIKDLDRLLRASQIG